MRLVCLPIESDDENKDEVIKTKERAILTLGETLSKHEFADGIKELETHSCYVHYCFCYAELGELIQTTRGMIEIFSKAKAAKLIRELVDRFLDMSKTTGKEVLSFVILATIT